MATLVGTGICQDIPDGISRFVVRARGGAPAAGTFYIGPCSNFPTIPCDGGEASGNLAGGNNWTHYRVVVPDGLQAWDLRCTSTKALEMVIRRSVPADSTSPTVTYNGTSWPPQGT
jgi:hypothetical protein